MCYQYCCVRQTIESTDSHSHFKSHALCRQLPSLVPTCGNESATHRQPVLLLVWASRIATGTRERASRTWTCQKRLQYWCTVYKCQVTVDSQLVLNVLLNAIKACTYYHDRHIASIWVCLLMSDVIQYSEQQLSNIHVGQELIHPCAWVPGQPADLKRALCLLLLPIT